MPDSALRLTPAQHCGDFSAPRPERWQIN